MKADTQLIFCASAGFPRDHF